MSVVPPLPDPVGVDAAALPAGHTVFEYRIEKMLGGGGFGITYLAHDINLELPVAIKEYFPGNLTLRTGDLSVRVRAPESEQPFRLGLERFLDEARALAAFRHPNIARVLRYFRENGTAYIVMEYESGDPLKRWLLHQPTLDQATLLGVIHPLMDGLEAVHQLNFLHRDIKPDNIYIRADGTPVLLDFGAARRFNGGRNLTNIVSPGFAPFEQYHSQGNQGPWSDLYSLGAVMYWMATGRTPVESASRIKDDPQARAQDIGNAALFGQDLLRAIDWALRPDEAHRPQNVAELRAVLAGAEPPAHVGQPLPGFGASVHKPRKNMLGTVMFLDLVAYSRHSIDQQVVLKERVNELMIKALKGVPEDSRIVIDTGDGAATCFLGDPEEALKSTLLLRGLLLQKYGQNLAVRIGLHLGPIRIVFDINQRVNVVGDGINVAQRIMDFAQPNQIVVSRAYYDVISRITDNAGGMFTAMGPHLDKHLRSHEIYAVLDAPPRPAPEAVGRREFEITASFAMLATLTPETVAEIEAELTQSIGPLAKVLIKKALPRCISARGLRELLAVSIPDATARELFLPPSSRRTQHLSHTAGHPAGMRTQPQADSIQPVSGPRSNPVSVPVFSPHFSAGQLAQLERTLSLFIGPMARMLVKQEVTRHATLETLLQALAAQVDRPAERLKFLAAAQKIQQMLPY